MTSWNQKSTSTFICCCAIKILATITPSSCLLSIPHPSYLIISTIFLLSLLLHPHSFSLSPCPFLLLPSTSFMIPSCLLFLQHPTPPPSNPLLLHLSYSFPILSFLYLLYLLPASSNAYLLSSAVLPHPACAACESKSSPSLGLHTALSTVAGNTNTYYLLCDLFMN